MAVSGSFSRQMIKKYLIVFILTFTNIVYLIPYLSLDFYNQFLAAYRLTDGQLGLLITYYGLTAVPGYFLGGWLADRFNPKKMIVASCMLTALVAVGVVFAPSYGVLLVLHLLYGVTSTMFNWGAYLKIIRMLGGDEEQGRLYGSADIAYGLFTLIIDYTVIVLTLTYLLNHPLGFKLAIFMYAILSVITGLAVHFLVPDVNNQKLTDDENTIKFNLIFRVLRMPITWYISFFTMGYFIIRSTMPYLNPYLTDGFGMSVALATGVVATFRTVSLVIMSPLGGVIRDKMGKSTPLVLAGGMGCLIFSLVLAYIPATATWGILAMVVGLFILICCSAVTSCLYTPVSEGKVDIAYTGTVLGIASAIGYSSDIWLYSLCGNWLDQYESAGYTYIWLLSAGSAVLMVVMGILLWRCYKQA